MSNSYKNVDLSSCDKEAIHLVGKIQAYGGFIAFTQDWRLAYCSKNIEKFTNLSIEECFKIPSEQLISPSIFTEIKHFAQELAPEQTQRVFAEFIFDRKTSYDISIHKSGELVIVEFEYHQPVQQRRSLPSFRDTLRSLSQTDSMQSLFVHATEQISQLTGYDRIMLYRFHNDGTGEVIAENKTHEMESFFGLRYPASDIPKQARRLYVKNLTRQIEDVDAETIDIIGSNDSNEEAIDLSLSSLRAVSPIHIEYLKNMGVGASFSLSIVVDGELWGLFACHHNSAKYMSLELRSIIEVYGEVFSLELAGRLRNASMVDTDRARSLQVSIMSAMNNEETVYNNLVPHIDSFHELIQSDSTVLWVDKKMAQTGAEISDEDIQLILKELNNYPTNEVVYSDNLASFLDSELTVSERYAGMLAIPISRHPKDFMIFLRKEETQAISWAGNPEKPVSLGPNGSRLTPRKSFAAWQELRKGFSAPWLEKEIGLAKLFRQMLMEIVIRNIDERERLIRESQQQQDMLIHELNHRVRNILGLISSVISKTASNAVDISEFKQVLGGRIEAIAVAQNHLTKRNWSHAPLQELIETELNPFTENIENNVIIEGPSVNLLPKAYTTLTLVVHELVTNAVKHGALRNDRGQIKIEWSLSHNKDLTIDWQESGYENELATKKGFGSIIISRSIPFDLNGTADVIAHGNGIDVTLSVPSKFVVTTDAQPKPYENSSEHTLSSPTARNALSSALIVEDNMIIALDLEDTLYALGVKKVFVSASSADAIKIINKESISFAILDVNLGGENSISIAKHLKELCIPFIFVTGYSELQGIKKEGFENVELLSKPFSNTDIKNFVDGLVK
ncbi:GAF domain-containing protein [Glaciecola sp. MH2013]|uniref:HWE histidine kinase domain-containing protein n=1 Tax=Glaciecola sp. MH2013 TaxID=2785524 RepID=UPI00189EC615|nr:HWE histidine kinase domain-containing protein [Glaciecola sp. MH2013]MBF7073552.1 GAF domain-containing protein [Glaciecola sp. MH2013]